MDIVTILPRRVQEMGAELIRLLPQPCLGDVTEERPVEVYTKETGDNSIIWPPVTDVILRDRNDPPAASLA